MYDLILIDIINDEVTRVNGGTMKAIISMLTDIKTASDKNRDQVLELEQIGKRIKVQRISKNKNN